MDETPHPKAWLSVNDVAKELDLGRSSIYALVASGKLACYRMGPNGGRLRFKPCDLEAYVEGVRVGPKVKADPVPRREKYVPKYPLGKTNWKR
jgi:excisionase family DNA binding protein